MSNAEAISSSVRVELGSRSYDVLIGDGLITSAGRIIEDRIGRRRAAIVTDENVAGHHLGALAASFDDRLLGHVTVPAGEASKSLAQLGRLTDELLAMGVERGDVIVALGGGVVGDLAGFAASILRRGVRFVQVPTSLLAQVDSSVGGKTGINTPHGKNLLGAFHQPSLVLADTGALRTLPRRELLAGYAEVVKYGLLGDRAFFDRLEREAPRLLANDPALLADAIEVSVRAKAGIVARDETETGERMLLNLGHTFGHALEAWAGFSSRLLHGEAVSIGMAQAFRYSVRAGLIPATDAARVEAHLKSVGLPTRVADIAGPAPQVETLMTLISQDKKVAQGRLTFILARGIGAAFIARDTDAAAIRDFLAGEIAG